MRSHARLALLRLRSRGRVRARGRARVERGVRVAAAPGALVVLEEGCALGERCRIEAAGGVVRIGAGARVGERAVLVARAGIDVGAGCVVGDWALVQDAEPDDRDPELPARRRPLRAAPVVLGDGARIGPHAAVLAGAQVAPGAVVAAYEVLRTARARSA